MKTGKHRRMEGSDIKLIDRVRAASCLYDTNNPNFRLIHKKEEEWQSIAEGLDMTDLDARKRWTVLRDRYSRELKQLRLHKNSAQYEKNDFFCRMDFLRKFVKKREPKQKSFNARDIEVVKSPRPLKLYKATYKSYNSESDDNQLPHLEKPYATDDSQYSSNGNLSYNEQVPQELIKQERHEDINYIEQECCEQQYQRYGEDPPVTYAVVHEDHESFMVASSNISSRHITANPRSSKVSDNSCIINAEEDKLSAQLQLQQSSINNFTQSASPTPPVDMEEYFSKTIALYLRRLSPRYKIKSKVEIMQIIEKYIDLQESKS